MASEAPIPPGAGTLAPLLAGLEAIGTDGFAGADGVVEAAGGTGGAVFVGAGAGSLIAKRTGK